MPDVPKSSKAGSARRKGRRSFAKGLAFAAPLAAAFWALVVWLA
ncbi:hypothetical protein [Croceibacterium soli]|nr:hypothetical protein [Croceibacterium soli]